MLQQKWEVKICQKESSPQPGLELATIMLTTEPSERGVFIMSRFTKIFSPLPNNKILDQSNLKDSADDKIDLTWNLNYVLGRIENIVGKGENAGYQHFLLFTQCFRKAPFQESLKVQIVWWRIKCRRLWKTMWNKEIMLVTDFYPFSKLWIILWYNYVLS